MRSMPGLIPKHQCPKQKNNKHNLFGAELLFHVPLTRIFNKGRRERSENAVNADSERSETFEEQRKKVRRHIEIFRGLLFTL